MNSKSYCKYCKSVKVKFMRTLNLCDAVDYLITINNERKMSSNCKRQMFPKLTIIAKGD